MTAFAFTETSRAVLRSLVPVVCPPEAVPLADAIVDHMELAIAVSPPLLRRGLEAGLRTYDLGALVTRGRRARSLVGDAADRYFRAWERGPTSLQRQLARGINQLMSLSCYEQPAMMDRVGYHPGPWIAEVTKKRLTVYADDVRRQEAQVIAPDPLRPRAAKVRA